MSAVLYLDHAATTPMRPQAAEAMAPYQAERFGNPSGVHAASRLAKNALEEARERAAVVLGCRPLEIVFCGGGTESDNLAVKGAALAGSAQRGVVTVATEHEAVLESVRFLERSGHSVTVAGVGPDGRVEPGKVAAAIDGDTAVVSVMWANNETGVLQPLAEIMATVKESRPDVAVHSDAVQAFVSEDVRVDRLPVDLLTLAAHKFGGPKGVGILYVRDGIELEPVLHGGGQELGRRSGTHNVAGAVGMAVAMEVAVADRERFRRDVGEARARFEQGVRRALPQVVLTGPPEGRLVQHSHLRVPGTSNETLLIRLDRAGVAASAGSACQSGATAASHVLAAMGMGPETARSCLRFSFGWTSTPAEGDQAARALVEAVSGP